MKFAFWFLTAVAAALLVVTISETQKLSLAYREVEKSTQLNAQVTTALIKLQRDNVAAIQLNRGSGPSSIGR